MRSIPFKPRTLSLDEKDSLKPSAERADQEVATPNDGWSPLKAKDREAADRESNAAAARRVRAGIVPNLKEPGSSALMS
jgi:hypothetical protein